MGELFNLAAAILCTVSSSIGAVAMFLSEPTFVNKLAGFAAVVATLGGIAWIIAAAIAVKRR